MYTYLFFIAFNILIFTNKITLSLSIRSKIFPVYKIGLTPNLSQMYKNKNYDLVINNIKGMGIIFDNDLDISIIPKQLGIYIEKYYNHFEEIMTDFIPNENGTVEIILNYFYGGSECLHFILENYGISVPISKLLIYEDNVHRFKFVMKENEENIIIGKELFELLGIDLSDMNNININDEYMSKIEDED